MNLNDLKKEVPYKWKPQTCGEYGTVCVAYVDSRQVQDLLDEVCQPENWQDDYYEVGGNLYCKIGIKAYDAWVWKTDCGVESNMEKEKGQASDAFKRAAVKWGVGRFLYSLGCVKLKSVKYKDKWKPQHNGETILDNDRLTEICTAIMENSRVSDSNLDKAIEQTQKQAEQNQKQLLTKQGEKVNEIVNEAFDQFRKMHDDFLANQDGIADFMMDKFVAAIKLNFKGKMPTQKSSIALILEKVKPEDCVARL